MPEQHAKVQEYVKSHCANYDRDGLCLLQTSESGVRLCPIFYEIGKKCNYATTSVLPGDAQIEALYNVGKTGAVGGNHCERCNESFQRTSNRQKFCPKCAEEVRKNRRIAYDAEQYRKAKGIPYIKND